MSRHGITSCFICQKSFRNGTCIYENRKCDHRICSACKIKIISTCSISCYVKYCSTKIMNYDWKLIPFRSYSSSTPILNSTRLASSWSSAGHESNKALLHTIERTNYSGLELGLTSTYITNKTVPLSPRNLKATSATEYDINLAWEPPRFGSDPRSYIIERQMKDGMRWELIKEINGSMTIYCVKDLEPETLYHFRIMSANEQGQSLPKSRHFKTEDVPKPTDLQVLNKTPTEVMLRWSVPNVGKKALGFDVKVTDTKTGNCKLRTELSNNEILIKDLQPDCRYEFCVASAIKGRSSSFAQLTKKTKPSEVEPKHKLSEITTNERVTDEKQYTEKEPVAKMQELKDDENKSIYLQCKETKEDKNMKVDLPHTKLKGIPNIGSTCYANCILQVLGQTPNLVPSLQNMVEQFTNKKKLPISSMLLTIFPKFDFDDGMYVDTRLIQDLTTEIHSIDPFFRRFRKNDCHSFLMCLFNVIQDEISSAQGELNNKTTKNPFEMFRGKMCNYFELPCNHSERTEDQVFTSLLIPIQETRTNEQWSIEKGLHLIMRSDEFDGEAFPCLKCQNKGLTSPDKKITRKTFGISEPPAILILQLGRFREVRGRLRKEDCDLTYETSLDIEVINHRTQIPACLKYELYSVVLHNGSIESGHYYSYVKSKTSGQWFNCSDRYVRNIQDPFEKGFSEAYLLFYRRLHY